MDLIRLRGIKKSKIFNYEGPDIISNLPDVIIGRILSFLPTKDAVHTSVLSKRWKYLWTFITELHFEDRKPYRRKKIIKIHFLNFVYRVLLHLNTLSIQSFSLYVSENYDPYHVNQWISAMLNRRVKEISIESRNNLDISWQSLLESQTLEKLELKMNLCAIRVPTFAYLSSLTFLKLFEIEFTCGCDPSNDSQNLTLNFPVLRKYETDNCSWSDVKGVTFEVPMLEVLLIQQSSWSICHESHTIIKFCAPRLSEFSFTGFVLPIQDIILLDLDLSTTRIASADIYPSNFIQKSEQITALFTSELLKQFNNNVECLKFERLEYLAIARDNLPAFGMLSRLEIEHVTGEHLLMFLRNTPFLRTLILQELDEFDEELLNPESVPSCVISKLEVVKFGIVKGVEHEMRFAKFVMENAQVLKRASFSPRSNLRRSIVGKVRKKILSFKRSDSFAFIDFLSL